jgi:hypothetical protein
MACQASHNKYAAPATRIASKASGTAISSAVKPSAAASRWATNPSRTPASEIKPAMRPWHKVRETQ